LGHDRAQALQRPVLAWQAERPLVSVLEAAK